MGCWGPLKSRKTLPLSSFSLGEEDTTVCKVCVGHNRLAVQSLSAQGLKERRFQSRCSPNSRFVHSGSQTKRHGAET